jgi:RNA polymerase sigma factor (sigma-70 family)
MQYQRQTAADLENHEQLFTARYQRLLIWALHLAGRDRAEAEDLLHDAYVQFTLTRPDLTAIRHLDNYLFGVLRVLWLSRQRRAGRTRLEQLSVIEYDSAEMGLWLSDPRESNRVQDELRAICRYACTRKETSKAGSVLILRFFHGYYPSEIAQLLNATRKAVDSRLALARQEARVFLEAPERLSFIKTNARANVFPAGQGGAMTQGSADITTRTGDELLRELRAEIFRSRQGECFSRAELQQLYDSETEALATDQLSHLASCPVCLEIANEILGLPPLSTRHPNDTIGNDPGDSGDGFSGNAADSGSDGPSSGGANGGTVERRAAWRAREVFEHHPQELHIAINGRLVASQRVHAELNEQTLELRPEDLTESPAFIEIFSEVGVRILLFPVGDLRAETLETELSDGRTLTATLELQGPNPLLTVVYRDPLAQTAPAGEPQPSWMTRAAVWLNQAFVSLAPRPVLLTALSVVLCAAGLLAYLRWPATPAVTAAELLQKSMAAEARLAGERGQVAHRSFNIETRDPATAKLIARRRVEMWQSADRGITARRLYDEQNRLLAGEWLRADGSREVVFRKGQPAPADLQIGEAGQQVWRSALDVRQFSDLLGTATASVEERSNTFVLSHQWPRPTNAGGKGDGAATSSTTPPWQLLEATLTLDSRNLRAIAQTLRVRTAGGVREHHVTEAAFEQLPLNSVLPAIFQPDPELLATAGARRIESALPDNTVKTAAAESVQPAGANLAALEIEARYLLDQANANLGEQVNLTRTAAGLQVRALVETEQRKAELLTALAPLRTKSGVTLDIATYDEAARRQSSRNAAPTLITDAVIAQKPIPVAAELRRYFSSQSGGGADATIDAQITRFAGRMQEQAARPLRHAWALDALASQFSPEDIAGLPPEAKAKWSKMLRTHALAVKRETARLRADLQPVFFADGPTLTTEPIEPLNLKQLAAQLVALTSRNDAVIGKAFARSAGDLAGAELKSSRFLLSLQRTEQLAETILKSAVLAE